MRNDGSTQVRRSKILVVDDDVDIRTNVRDLLEDQGYAVDVAMDGEAAVSLAQRHHYDLAILDFKMPGMNGAALYRRLREIRPRMQALLITAYAGNEGLRQAKHAGVWQVLRKPVDMEDVFRLVEEATRDADKASGA